MVGFWVRLFVTAVGLLVASGFVSGIEFSGVFPLLAASLVLGVVNAIVRPIFVVLTIPFTVITLGLFLLVVNASMLGLAALIVPGFSVADFWSALFGSIIVSITGVVASWYIGPRGTVEVIIVDEGQPRAN